MTHGTGLPKPRLSGNFIPKTLLQAQEKFGHVEAQHVQNRRIFNELTPLVTTSVTVKPEGI
jgi:hypothetical protein